MADCNYSTVKQTTTYEPVSASLPTEREAFIAVLGATGSGKTTASSVFRPNLGKRALIANLQFINSASGGSLEVGRGLQSCTSTIQRSSPFDLRGRQVTLVDTPGFDDTNRSDVDIWKTIATSFATMYKRKQTFAGVIYIHRISDVRVGGISRRNFKIFRELCGDHALKNVIIVTNMWGEVGRDVGEAREAELAREDMFFKLVLEKGAQLVRHDNTTETARAILLYLIDNKPLPLQIQTELVDQGKNLSETVAGAELNCELMEQIKNHEHDMRELQKEMQDAIQQKDEETRTELEAEAKKLQAEMIRVQNDAQQLVSDCTDQRAELERNRLATDAEISQMQVLKQELKQTVNAYARERENIRLQIADATSRANRTTARKSKVLDMIYRVLEELGGWYTQPYPTSTNSTK